MAIGADESSLWAEALGGDARALARLFVTHRDRVFRHALRVTGDPTDADDAAAAAFFELWRRRESVPLVDGSVLPWLLVTAANLARNVRRGTRRYRDVLDRLPRDATPQDPAEQALARVAAARAEGSLGAALRALRPVDLALLGLTVFEGYSVAEAALATGVTESAARTRLSRTRARLRTVLSTQEESS